MFHAKPPFRLAMGVVLMDGKPRTPADVIDALKSEYEDGKLLTPANVEEQLQALKAVGIVKIVAEVLDDSGKLLQTYAISDYGREKVRKNL